MVSRGWTVPCVQGLSLFSAQPGLLSLLNPSSTGSREKPPVVRPFGGADAPGDGVGHDVAPKLQASNKDKVAHAIDFESAIDFAATDAALAEHASCEAGPVPPMKRAYIKGHLPPSPRAKIMGHLPPSQTAEDLLPSLSGDEGCKTPRKNSASSASQDVHVCVASSELDAESNPPANSVNGDCGDDEDRNLQPDKEDKDAATNVMMDSKAATLIQQAIQSPLNETKGMNQEDLDVNALDETGHAVVRKAQITAQEKAKDAPDNDVIHTHPTLPSKKPRGLYIYDPGGHQSLTCPQQICLTGYTSVLLLALQPLYIADCYMPSEEQPDPTRHNTGMNLLIILFVATDYIHTEWYMMQKALNGDDATAVYMLRNIVVQNDQFTGLSKPHDLWESWHDQEGHVAADLSVIFYAPFITVKQANHKQLSVAEITNSAFKLASLMAQKYMAYCMMSRGDMVSRDVNALVATIHLEKTPQIQHSYAEYEDG